MEDRETGEFEPIPFDSLVQHYVRKLEEKVAAQYDDVSEDDLEGTLSPAADSVEQQVAEVGDVLEDAGRRLDRQIHAELYGEVPETVTVDSVQGMKYRLEDGRGTRKLVAERGDEYYDVILSGQTAPVHPQVYALDRLISLPPDLEAVLDEDETPEKTKISVAWTKLAEKGVRDDNDELAEPLSAAAMRDALDRFAYEYWAEHGDLVTRSTTASTSVEIERSQEPDTYEGTVDYVMAGYPVVSTDGHDELVIKEFNGMDVAPEELEDRDVTVRPIDEDGTAVELVDVQG